MAANYFLMNGKNGNARALKLLTKDGLKRSFIDISALDLVTMDISDKDKVNILEENNKGIDLSGTFYDASYPHKDKKTKTYIPLFDMTNVKTKYYMDKLRYFAEQRNYKKEHGMPIALDQNYELESYIRKMMSAILSGYKPSFVSYDSLLAAKLKDILKEGYVYKNDSMRFINGKIYILRNLFGNYTQLRNITIEYMHYLNGKSIKMRNTLGRLEHYENKDMEEIIPPIEEENVQLTLDQFMDMGSISLKKTLK